MSEARHLSETLRLTPRDAAEVQSAVAEAGASGRKLEIVGGGTKRRVGRLRRVDAVLSTSALDAVIDYQPDELILTVQPGAALERLELLVAAQGQMLPFEPPRLTSLLGGAGAPTIGGVLSANLSGPRRIRAGAARDHLLGFAAVSGRGEIFKAGGKVVKNVTGYDLMKLMCGAWGTLAVLTEVTLKVLPAPQAAVTLLLFGLDDAAASAAMTVAMNGPYDISGAAHLPRAAAAAPPLGAEQAVTALRIDGFHASAAARAEALIPVLRTFGRVEMLDDGHTRDFWRQIREAECMAGGAGALWRLSLPPAAAWRAVAELRGEALYDWAGGLVWLRSDMPADAVRRIVRAHSGHGLCLEGGAAFAPREGPLGELQARVKAAFDPLGVLNPGRMEGTA